MLVIPTMIAIACPAVTMILFPIDFPHVFESICCGYIDTLRVFYYAQLVVVCGIIQERFKAFNICLSEFESSNQNKKLQDYGKLFNSLCKGIELINQAFTPQCVLLVLNTLVNALDPFFILNMT